MIAFPIIATIIALVCAARIGWDAWHRPRPERAVWAIAFAVFAVAAGSEVIGSLLGWTATLARVYYLAGAVLVVGLLALGELYLLFPRRMPALTPGIALLVVAVAATTVWSAPVNVQALQTQGWAAIEKSPFLIALAATINAVGTLVLVGGALYSAWNMRSVDGSRQRLVGCVLIALGALMVATGGTLTRFGQREYLYVAMSVGVSTIFAGILLTRSGARRSATAAPLTEFTHAATRPHLIPFKATPNSDVGLRFVAQHVLTRESSEVSEFCRQWSSVRRVDHALTRQEARSLWSLRLQLADDARARLDVLPLATQAQVAELFDAVWAHGPQEHEGAQRKSL